MNERIKELRKQAIEFANATERDTDYRWDVACDTKFAELIVKECANVAADHDALDIYEEIREHFGVEE